MVALLKPFVFMCMTELRTTAWIDLKSEFGWSIASCSTHIILAETGANKSGPLGLLMGFAQNYFKTINEDFSCTDFTVEALCSFMADHGGKALVHLDEAKVRDCCGSTR